MAEFIVAIELGSSKIRGIAGKKKLDGSIDVAAVVKENASECIRKGIVYNIDKTAQCLTSIITKLRKQLKYEITQVFVGVGGQSIRSVRNVIIKDLPNDTIITSDMINELMDANRNMSYPDQEILDAVTQEYNVDNQKAIDPVGIKANRLEGNFLNILWRQSFYDNLNNCFQKADVKIAEMYLAPLALADSVLSESERRGGCVLVDLGADTTTVLVYYKNLLRHLAVIPLGSNNITRDLASLQIDEKDAERMKLKYASAFTETSAIDTNAKYTVNKEQSIDCSEFIKVVEARVTEIIENVWAQVPTDYSHTLLGGIILTGGGMNLPNIEHAFRDSTGIGKIRKANFVTYTINASASDITSRRGDMNTVLGILTKGDMNCAGATYNPNANNLFTSTEEIVTGTPISQNSHTSSPKPLQGQGLVPTLEDKKKQEEERRRREEEERRLREEEEERIRKEKEEERKNSFWGKFSNKIKDISGKIFEADEE